MPLLFHGSKPRNGSKRFAKFQIVDLHSIVEVEFNTSLGERQDDVALPLLAFVEGFGDLSASLRAAVLSRG